MSDPSKATATRDRILAKIRRSLGAAPGDAAREMLVTSRISTHARHPLPARTQLDPAALRAQFSSFLTRGFATVVDVATRGDIPVAIATYLREHDQPPRLRMGADPRLAILPWETAPGLERRFGRADPSDVVTLSYAVAAASETGTLLLASGPDNPVTLSFLPETHLVILEAATLKGSYEDAFDIVRASLGPGVMPRTLNLISGPSRTSDIGGKTVMGAHGPRHLAVFVAG